MQTLPMTNRTNPRICRGRKSCHPNSNVTDQMINVRPLSSTTRVVDDNSFVTDIPAKLKNAMENTLPRTRVDADDGPCLSESLTNGGQNDDPIVTHLTESIGNIFETMIRTRVGRAQTNEVELSRKRSTCCFSAALADVLTGINRADSETKPKMPSQPTACKAGMLYLPINRSS